MCSVGGAWSEEAANEEAGRIAHGESGAVWGNECVDGLVGVGPWTLAQALVSRRFDAYPPTLVVAGAACLN